MNTGASQRPLTILLRACALWLRGMVHFNRQLDFEETW